MKIKKMLILIVFITVIVMLLLLLMRFIGLFEGTIPGTIGLINNQLRDCPLKRNCVSSSSRAKAYYIKPLAYALSPEASIQKISTVLLSMNGVSITTKTVNYIHAESKSQILGFVDDVEIHCDSVKQQCFVRSASRLGHSDFAVNRKRIEMIRLMLEAN